MCDEQITRHVMGLRGQRLAEAERERQRQERQRLDQMIRDNQNG